MTLSLRQVQQQEGAYSAVLQESISGMRVVQAFTAEERELEKFQAANWAVRERSLDANRNASLRQPMIIFLAGLQGIDDVYYEAAKIDGAGRWAQLIHITIPMMSSVVFFNLIMGIINSFQVFAAGFLITNGAPQNSTLFYVLYLYRVGFQQLKMGYAASLSWMLFLIILVLTLIIFKTVGKTVYYQD
jgi:ABC-type multidrug transport system fused ATPase/permease subunit